MLFDSASYDVARPCDIAEVLHEHAYPKRGEYHMGNFCYRNGAYWIGHAST